MKKRLEPNSILLKWERFFIDYQTKKNRELDDLASIIGALLTRGPTVKVPSLAEGLLLLVLPKKDGFVAVGDLNESFPEIVAKRGVRFARWWYRAQAAMVLMNSLLSLVERLAKLFKRSG